MCSFFMCRWFAGHKGAARDVERSGAQVWEHAEAAGCEPDCRMCTTLIEVATRKGDTARSLAMYERMRAAPPGSRLAPSVHAFTAAMRAAAEGGCWARALEVWADMEAAGCRPTGAALHVCMSFWPAPPLLARHMSVKLRLCLLQLECT